MCSPMKPQGENVPNSLTVQGWVFISYMFHASHKAMGDILILINTSASLKIQNCENGQVTKSPEALLLGRNP